jgi:hypothetical protein
MNAARLHKSGRLLRVLRELADGGEHTTRELIEDAGVCAVNSIAAELRANGINVSCRCLGRGHYAYRLGDGS